MPRGNGIVVVALILSLAFYQNRCLGQEGSKPGEKPSASPVETSTTEIPIEILRKVTNGYGGQVAVKHDLSAEQIQAMRKILDVHTNRESTLHLVSGASFTRNRRFTTAIEQIRKEGEEKLRKAWLTIITPEQQDNLRRRNRQAMDEALRTRSQASAFIDSSPIDNLLVNNERLLILERPAIQDTLELTDSQIEVVEKQRSLAALDAVDSLRQVIDLFAKHQLENPVKYESPDTQPQARLMLETRKILTGEQWTQYVTLRRDPQWAANLIQELGWEKAQPLLEPHGFSGKVTYRIESGKSIAEPTLHNAFDNSQMIETLKLTPEQQQRIAKQLEVSTSEIIAARNRSIEAQRQIQAERNEKLDEIWKAHNARVNAPIATLLTDEQQARLEKERFRGLGLAALQNPMVIQKLELTEAQSTVIAAALQQPGPKVPMMKINVTSSEEFQKNSQEHQRQMAEYSKLQQAHWQTVCQQIEKHLRPVQREKFIELTGFAFQPPSDEDPAPTAIAAPESGEVKR